MVGFHTKKSIIYFVVISLLQHSVLLGQAAIEKNSAPESKFKNASNIIAGIGLAFVAHIVSEYFTLHAHEYGHVAGDKLSGGSGGKVAVECLLGKSPFAIFFPFSGCTTYEGGRQGNEIVSGMGGPVAGILTTYCFVIACQIAQSSCNGQSLKQGAYNGLKKPVTVYAEIANQIESIITRKNEYKILSLKDAFFITFALLKSGRMIGEFLYGLTPFSINGGDGEKLWQKLGVKKNMTVDLFVIFGLAALPTFVAICFGIMKGRYKARSLKENEPSRH